MVGPWTKITWENMLKIIFNVIASFCITSQSSKWFSSFYLIRYFDMRNICVCCTQTWFHWLASTFFFWYFVVFFAHIKTIKNDDQHDRIIRLRISFQWKYKLNFNLGLNSNSTNLMRQLIGFHHCFVSEYTFNGSDTATFAFIGFIYWMHVLLHIKRTINRISLVYAWNVQSKVFIIVKYQSDLILLKANQFLFSVFIILNQSKSCYCM